ncbi:alkaline phosphatase [uncultured Lamprocystis sp.]|jgi:alkaline phosphatase|uniref:alkaline phosphatase n=1 Tax=uncultured Lamprocystis sp. TaxID=543132 RepID=UPI0025DC7543|nr:alkaline phosphatase [uncultured Lamprocystis sp.]
MKKSLVGVAVRQVLSAALIASYSLGVLADPVPREAKHIILLIGDGMNIEHEIAASRYLFGNDFDLSFHNLPYQGNQSTWDVSTYKYWSGGTYDPRAIAPTLGYDPAQGGKAPYPLRPERPGAEAYLKAKATDSASAATAWASGYKTDDGNLSWLPGDPDTGGNRTGDGSLKTIAEHLRERKDYAIGVVSTVPFTHATPAAFVSHNKSRNNYGAIGHEILTTVKPDVVIGGGHPGYDGSPTHNYIAAEDYDNLKNGVYADEYVFVERTAGVDGGLSLLTGAQQAVAEGKKLFGLFGKEGDGNFESLKPNDLPATPTVTQATRENPTYTEATLAALKVLSQDPDGFFLMAEQGDIDWANHANDFQRMVGTIKDLHDGVQAVIDFVNQPNDDIDWRNTLLIVTSDHSNNYMRNRTVLGAGDLPEQTPNCMGTPCYPGGEVTFGTTGHTNELTRIYAMGAGSRRFEWHELQWYPGTRILDNTQVFRVMMEAAGVPQVSPLRIRK